MPCPLRPAASELRFALWCALQPVALLSAAALAWALVVDLEGLEA